MTGRVPLVVAAAAIVVVGGSSGAIAASALQGSFASAAVPAALGAPRFVEVTASAGVDQRYAGDPPYEVGGGVAAFDCDHDGFPDLYFAGGSEPAALYRNRTTPGGPIRFERARDPETDVTGVTGAYPLDVDADGNVDLAVLRQGESLLLRGVGGCRFERANEAWGFDAGANEDTTAFAATWEDQGSLPTLAIGRYLTLDASGGSTFDCAPNALIRPDASGRRYGAASELTPGFCTLSALFSDWDRSGRRDLRLANDRHYYLNGTDQLWRMERGVAPRTYTTGDGWVRLQIWGMGIAAQDLTGDGYPEYYVTSQADQKLQSLAIGPAKPQFRDLARRLGVNAAQPVAGGDARPSTGWHPEFADVNDDGYLDLLVTKGNVVAQPDYATVDATDLLVGRSDGTFAPAADAAGIVADYRGRGAALVDLDLDGLLDLVENPYLDHARIRRNVGAGTLERPVAMGASTSIRLIEPGANRDAIGAWVEAVVGGRTIQREIVVGGGHAGGQLGWLHLGLGTEREARVRVTWPDGQRDDWLRIPAGGFFIVERGTAPITAWRPGEPAP